MDRNRKVETRTVKASDLIPNPLNWRRHPEHQRSVLTGVMDQIGDVDYLKVVEVDGELMLIDGHLRADIAGDEDVDVVVLDLDEDEQKMILATFDPIGALAQAEEQPVRSLLSSIEFPEGSLGVLLSGMRRQFIFEPAPLDQLVTQYGEPDPSAFWPEVRIKAPQTTVDAFNEILETFSGITNAERLKSLVKWHNV